MIQNIWSVSQCGKYEHYVALFTKYFSRKRKTFHTVKKSNFPATKILREINLGDSRSAKSAILTHLEALNFDFHEFLKAEIYQTDHFQSP